MDLGAMDHLAAEADALAAAVDEERFRHVAGLEREPALARLFAARPRAAHRDTVKALREAGNAALADRVAALRAGRAQAEAEEAWRAADSAASGDGPDGRAPLASLEGGVPRERDPVRRRALAQAAAQALEEVASLRERAVEERARAAAEVGLAPDWRAVVEGDGVLAASDDAYRDVLAFALRRDVPEAERSPSRADLLRALALPRWDGLFRPGMLAVSVKLTAAPLGLELGRVRVDEEARPAKWPGAHAHGARISFRPRGGAGDWQDLLAAVGRAVAAAGRGHPALGEALAWLLASLLLEPRWLADRADVERRDARDVARDLALRRLFALRADAAALRIAAEVDRGLSGAAWRDGYRDALTAATGAEWDAARASRDAEGARLVLRLRGSDAGERLRRDLVERFDEDWWRNPRTAASLAGILAAGALPGPALAPEAPAGGEAVRHLLSCLGG